MNRKKPASLCNQRLKANNTDEIMIELRTQYQGRKLQTTLTQGFKTGVQARVKHI